MNSKLAQLYLLLDEAEALAAQFNGGYSSQFLNAQEFHGALSRSIENLKRGRFRELRKLDLWFLPTCFWDGFIGSDGMDLANQISPLLSELRAELDN